MNKSLLLLISVFSICFILFAASLQAQSASPADSQAIIKQLKAENAHLKEEIQNLRKLLGSSPTQPSPIVNTSTTAPTADKPAIQPSGDVKTTGFWLTSSSKKRHNSACRYFKTSNGTECGPSDGTPCKICGG